MIENMIFEFKLLSSNPKIGISIQKFINYYENGHFNFEYLYMNRKFYISTLKLFHLNFK